MDLCEAKRRVRVPPSNCAPSMLFEGEALIRNEVIPVVGDLQKPETWEWVIEKATYVIDTVPGYLSQEPWKGNRTLLEALAKSSEATGIRKTFIQTSGTLRYPDSKQVQDENTPIPPSDHPIFQAGREFEKLVLSHPVVPLPFPLALIPKKVGRCEV